MLNNPYIPWNVNMLYDGINALRSNIGVAFNVGIGIFLVVTGIYIVIAIVNRFGG